LNWQHCTTKIGHAADGFSLPAFLSLLGVRPFAHFGRIPFLLKADTMPENKQIHESLDELRDAIVNMDKRLERIHCQIDPLVKLMQGNGKEGLPTRLTVTERRLSVMERSAAWVMRLTVTTLLSAIGAVVYMLLSRV
jgi:hypothetical protein